MIERTEQMGMTPGRNLVTIVMRPRTKATMTETLVEKTTAIVMMVGKMPRMATSKAVTKGVTKAAMSVVKMVARMHHRMPKAIVVAMIVVMIVVTIAAGAAVAVAKAVVTRVVVVMIVAKVVGMTVAVANHGVTIAAVDTMTEARTGAKVILLARSYTSHLVVHRV
jgi:hypothetical protein